MFMARMLLLLRLTMTWLGIAALLSSKLSTQSFVMHQWLTHMNSQTCTKYWFLCVLLIVQTIDNPEKGIPSSKKKLGNPCLISQKFDFAHNCYLPYDISIQCDFIPIHVLHLWIIPDWAMVKRCTYSVVLYGYHACVCALYEFV